MSCVCVLICTHMQQKQERNQYELLVSRDQRSFGSVHTFHGEIQTHQVYVTSFGAYIQLLSGRKCSLESSLNEHYNSALLNFISRKKVFINLKGTNIYHTLSSFGLLSYRSISKIPTPKWCLKSSFPVPRFSITSSFSQLSTTYSYL